MMSRIFHVDLDGTLLTTDKRIGDRTREAINYFTKQGNYLVINTGRALSSAKMIFDMINVEPGNCFISAFNGNCIYDCARDEIISQCYVRKEVALDLYRMAREDGIYLITYEGDKVLCEMETPASQMYCGNSRMQALAVGDMQKYLNHDVPKVLSVELSDWAKARNFADKVKKLYGDELTVCASNQYLYEMFNINGGKDKAVYRLCELLGVGIENTIAAGDAENDLPMLRAAGRSVAVRNATEEVKSVADEITLNDNDHDALADLFIDTASSVREKWAK